MKNKVFNFEIGEIAAISTWAVVYGITLYFMLTTDRFNSEILPVSVLFVAYLACFIGLGRPGTFTPSAHVEWGMLAVMIISAYLCMLLIPAGYLAILSIIWVAVLIHFVSIKICIIITILVIISWFGLFSWRWEQQNIWFSAALYGSFHFFSILMAHQTQEAQQGKERLERLNNELQATQNLIEQASRQQERTRIARDLHDLIGHHLTALIINLEVAKHQTQGPAKQQVEQSHALAKLLLSDVREAITEIRANESIDIDGLIELWRGYTPTIEIHTDIAQSISWSDLTIAQTVSFCILEALTNSMRHANAKNVFIVILDHKDTIEVTIHDDGAVKGELNFGNGLRGMQERLAEIKGNLSTSIIDGHLELKLRIPLEHRYDH